MHTFSERHGLSPLGAGVGLRREFYDALPGCDRRVDWVEVIPENFLTLGGKPQRVLAACAERWRVVPHGVGLNVGGPDALDEDYLERLRRLVRQVEAPFFSDHLCYSQLGGIALHELLPLPFSEASVEHVVPRVRRAMDVVERPLLLENPTYYATMPGQTMGEADFLRAVLEQADCGLLLDVNNVFVNARNHGYNPYAFIDALPLERVVQVHLAGHTVRPDVLIDTHVGPVPSEVWALFRYTLQRTGPVSTLVEWDQDIPTLAAVLDEADQARELLVRKGSA